MGYFDAIAKSGQIDEADGTVRFYPWGQLRPGYRLTSEKAKEVRRFTTPFQMGGLLGAMLISLFLNGRGWKINAEVTASFLLVVSVIYAVRLHALLDGVPRTTVPFSVLENSRSMAGRIGRPTLLRLLFTSLLLVAASAFILFTAKRFDWLALISLLLFGACLGLFSYQLSHLNKQNSPD